jgi:hypothetical protein
MNGRVLPGELIGLRAQNQEQATYHIRRPASGR